MLTTERVRELFDYLPTGKLVRLVRHSRRSKVGEEIGSTDSLGYRQASVDGRIYMVHRLIWLWHGNDAAEELDHINGNRADNRIENLRAATHAQNGWNKRLQSNNTTGVKGVTWKREKQMFCVRVAANGQRHHIGYFKSLEAAALAAETARLHLHGAFAH